MTQSSSCPLTVALFRVCEKLGDPLGTQEIFVEWLYSSTQPELKDFMEDLWDIDSPHVHNDTPVSTKSFIFNGINLHITISDSLAISQYAKACLACIFFYMSPWLHITLGMTSNFQENSLSLHCKDRPLYLLPRLSLQPNFPFLSSEVVTCAKLLTKTVHTYMYNVM